jgi:hypothetical protein
MPLDFREHDGGEAEPTRVDHPQVQEVNSDGNFRNIRTPRTNGRSNFHLSGRIFQTQSSDSSRLKSSSRCLHFAFDGN